jgi:hypothetical protein
VLTEDEFDALVRGAEKDFMAFLKSLRGLQ